MTSKLMTKFALGALLLAAAVGAQAATCPMNYAAAPSQATIAANGGYGSFSVNVPAGCPWSVAPMYGWATIVSGTSFNGPGTVTYYVMPNPSRASRENFIWVIGAAAGPNGSTTRGRLMITQR